MSGRRHADRLGASPARLASSTAASRAARGRRTSTATSNNDGTTTNDLLYIPATCDRPGHRTPTARYGDLLAVRATREECLRSTSARSRAQRLPRRRGATRSTCSSTLGLPVGTRQGRVHARRPEPAQPDRRGLRACCKYADLQRPADRRLRCVSRQPDQLQPRTLFVNGVRQTSRRVHAQRPALALADAARRARSLLVAPLRIAR